VSYKKDKQQPAKPANPEQKISRQSRGIDFFLFHG
jgi:hypothetical protein